MFGLSLPAIPFLPFLSGNRDPDPDPVILSRDQVDEIGRELDTLRESTVASLGSEDRDYIYRVIKAQRGFEVAGRGLLFLGFLPPAWIACCIACERTDSRTSNRLSRELIAHGHPCPRLRIRAAQF